MEKTHQQLLAQSTLATNYESMVLFSYSPPESELRCTVPRLMSRFPMIRPALLVNDDVVELYSDDAYGLNSKWPTAAAAAAAAAAVAAMVTTVTDDDDRQGNWLPDVVSSLLRLRPLLRYCCWTWW